MNWNIEKLYAIAKKPVRRIIGLMSGTSLDGLDIALCRIEGNGVHTKIVVEQFTTTTYPNAFKEKVKAVFSKEQVNLQQLTLLNEWIAKQHAGMINAALQQWKMDAAAVDLIASHGQTIYHAPLSLHGNMDLGNGTLQIGDGDHLAVNTNIITISDFRQKHIAAGGEGAPLAAYGDYLLFKEKDRDVVLLNIGGIANFTWLPAGDDDAIFSSDTGPGNTMMDAWTQLHFPSQHFDKDALIAQKGEINEKLLLALADNDFLKAPLPKTTGPELFNMAYLENAMSVLAPESLPAEDVMHTLNYFTASTIAHAINPLLKRKTIIFVSGGGMHNPLLLKYIENLIPHAVIHSTEEKGIHPDAKEAVLFALLANEAVAGNASDFPKGLKNFPAVCMGKISFPA